MVNKYLLLVIALYAACCQSEKLTPEEVSIQFMEALVRLDFTTARTLVRKSAIPELDREMARMKVDFKDRKVRQVRAEIVERYEQNGQPCFSVMVHFESDGRSEQQDGYTCLVLENGQWKVGE